MILETHLIPEGHSAQNGLADLEKLKEDLPLVTRKMECRLEIDRCGPTIFLHIWFTGEFKIECSRCLELFPFTVEGDFRVVLKEESGKCGRSLDDDVADFYFNDRDDKVDLSPLLYEEIQTAFPLMPLCSSECKGIVVNDSDISIEYEPGKKEQSRGLDPRWDALRKLKQN